MLKCVFSLLQKDFNLKITLPGLEEGSQSLKIRLLPGNGRSSVLVGRICVSVSVFPTCLQYTFWGKLRTLSWCCAGCDRDAGVSCHPLSYSSGSFSSKQLQLDWFVGEMGLIKHQSGCPGWGLAQEYQHCPVKTMMLLRPNKTPFVSLVMVRMRKWVS